MNVTDLAALPAAILIRTAVEGIRTALGISSERVLKGLVFVLSFAAAYFFNVDVAAQFGLKTSFILARYVANTLLLGVGTMLTHDGMDWLAGKR